MRYLALAILVPFGVFAFAACGDDGEARPPPVVTGDGGPPAADKAARAAVVLGSCVPDDGVHRYLKNLYYNHMDDRVQRAILKDSVECLATRNNGCQAIADCTGVTVDIAEGCQRGCDGTRITQCDGSLRSQADCARFGLECHAHEGRVACALPGANSCTIPVTGYRPECIDGRARECESNVEIFGPKCADFGLTCSGARCAGTEGTCQGDSYSNSQTFGYASGVECTNGTLKACVNNGLTTIACSKLSPDFTCQQRVRDSGTPVVYCGLGSACEASDHRTMTCEGDSVVVCNAGRIDKVDCKSLGFDRCDPRFGCAPNGFVP